MSVQASHAVFSNDADSFIQVVTDICCKRRTSDECRFISSISLASSFGKDIYYLKRDGTALGELSSFSPLDLHSRNFGGIEIASHCTPAVTRSFGERMLQLMEQQFSLVEDTAANTALVKLLNQVENSVVKIAVQFDSKGKVSMLEPDFPKHNLAEISVLSPSEKGSDFRLSVRAMSQREIADETMEAYRSLSTEGSIWNWKNAQFNLPQTFQKSHLVPSYIAFKQELKAYKTYFEGFVFRVCLQLIRMPQSDGAIECLHGFRVYFCNNSYSGEDDPIEQLVEAC